MKLLIFLLAGTLAAQAPVRVSRASLMAMERGFNERLANNVAQEPFEMLEPTMGLYLDGYGAVFATQLSLIYSPTINPFRLTMTKQEVAKVHERKLKQLPILKQNMREMLLASSVSLDGVRAAEQIALSVSLFHYNWEDASGIPAQIVMQAEKQKLIEVQTGRTARSELDNIIRVQEL